MKLWSIISAVSSDDERIDRNQVDTILQKLAAVTYLNLLDKIIILRYGILTSLIKEQHNAEALAMINTETRLEITSNVQCRSLEAPLFNALESKMTTIAKELLRRGINITKYILEISTWALKVHPKPIPDEWPEVLNMMIDNFLTSPIELHLAYKMMSSLTLWKSKRLGDILADIEPNNTCPEKDIERFVGDDVLSCPPACFQLFFAKCRNEFKQHWNLEAVLRTYNRHFDIETITRNLRFLVNQDIVRNIQEFYGFWSNFLHTFLPRITTKPSEISQDQLYCLMDCILQIVPSINASDMNNIYYTLGYDSLFKAHLLRPVLVKLNLWQGQFPELFYNVNMSKEQAITNALTFKPQNVGNLISFFADGRLKAIALRSEKAEIVAQAKKLPAIPTLVELGRNECRKYLVSVFRLENARDLYLLVDRLPVPTVYKRILLLEQKIY